MSVKRKVTAGRGRGDPGEVASQGAGGPAERVAWGSRCLDEEACRGGGVSWGHAVQKGEDRARTHPGARGHRPPTWSSEQMGS